MNLNEIEYFKKANVPSNLEFLVSYNNNKPILKKISLTENQNRFKLSNVHFSKDFKIIKFDEVNLNYINKNKILNNLKIKNVFDKHPKTLLQEYSLKYFKEIPIYTVEEKSGPDHKPKFKVTVSINSEIYANGLGPSTQKAQENAAKNLLKKLESKN